MATPAMHIPALTIPDEAWQPDEPGRLTALVVLNGTFAQAEAIEVEMRPAMPGAGDPLQEAAHDGQQARFLEVIELVNPDGPLATVDIAGRHYVVVISPLGE